MCVCVCVLMEGGVAEAITKHTLHTNAKFAHFRFRFSAFSNFHSPPESWEM